MAGTIRDDGLVVCDCGQPHEMASAVIEELREHLMNTQMLLSSQVSKNRALLKEQNGQLTAHKHYKAGVRVLETWQELCMPTARELGGARLKLVLDRLAGGETEERLLKAVLGYSRYPYMVNFRRVKQGGKDSWKAEAEYVFRNPKNVEAGIRLAELDEDYQGVFTPSTEPDLSPIGQTALKCIALGWKVFPCRVGSKQPTRGSSGLLEATDDRQRVIDYWSKVPFANLAVRTGQESNLIVLDVDTDVGGMETLKALQEKFGPLPPTLSVVTPSGGSHFYFRHPGYEIRNTTGVPGVGLDIRGDGGYVVAPPSKVNGNLYEMDDELAVSEMPEWLSNGLRQYQVNQATRGKGVWAEVVEKGVAEGGRNAQVTSLVGKLVSSNMSAEQVGIVAHSINHSHCRPPLQAREVDAIVASVLRTHARKAAQ